MEFLNKIELRGVVGRADLNAFNGIQVCNFSVVTEYSAVDKDGNPSVDTAWFNVKAWEGRAGSPLDLSRIQKGIWVRVVGRVRQRKYTKDDEDRTSWDVLARVVELIPREDEQPMQPQRDW